LEYWICEKISGCPKNDMFYRLPGSFGATAHMRQKLSPKERSAELFERIGQMALQAPDDSWYNNLIRIPEEEHGIEF
jgi:hypothetical protein